MLSRKNAKEVAEKRSFLEKVRIGLRQSEAGQVVSFDEARIRLEKWQIDNIDQRRAEMLSGENKGTDWQTMHNNIKKQGKN